MEKIRIKNNSGDKDFFTIVPNYILNHSTPYDRDLYIQMKRIAGDDGTCWTSQKRLAKQCGISINRLKKSLNYLLEHKWIKFLGYKDVITKGGEQKVCEYSIVNIWDLNNGFYRDKGVSRNDTPTTKGCHENTQRGVTKNEKGYHEVTTNKNHLNNITIKKNIADKSAGSLINELIELFNFNPAYTHFFKNKTQREALGILVKARGEDFVRQMIKKSQEIRGQEFAPKVDSPCQLRDKILKVEEFNQSAGTTIY